MKHLIQKWLSLLMAVLLLLTVCVGCADNRDEPEDQTENTAEEVTEVDPSKTLDVPSVTFGGTEFPVLSADYSEYYTPLDVEGYNGDVVNDAIYARNRYLEEVYQITFVNDLIDWGRLLSEMEKQVSGGNGDYELIMLLCRDAYTATIKNYLTNYDNLPYVDVEKDYYFRDLNKQFTIGNRMFFAFSAESINALSFANCILFNKNIAANRNMPDFYQMLADNEWTYAEMFRYAEEGALDVEGDGKMVLGNDVMGLIGDFDKINPAAWISADEYLITKDENDIPAYTCIQSERFIDVMQYVLENFSKDYVVAFTAFDNKFDVFMNGKSFMWAHQVGKLRELSAMSEDYGVLPWPKYDLEQEHYVSRAEDAWLHCVPTTCKDTEKTSIILQSLAYYSYNSVYDAYYKQALTAKYLRDPQSVDSLKQIVATMTVDIGDNVWYEKLRSKLVDSFCSQKGKTNLTSTLKKYERVANSLIKEAMNFVDKAG